MVDEVDRPSTMQCSSPLFAKKYIISTKVPIKLQRWAGIISEFLDQQITDYLMQESMRPQRNLVDESPSNVSFHP
jgi:hypothetical protein